jgi:hypothetical protein
VPGADRPGPRRARARQAPRGPRLRTPNAAAAVPLPSRAPHGSPRPRHGNNSVTRPVPSRAGLCRPPRGPRPTEGYKKNVGACGTVRACGPFRGRALRLLASGRRHDTSSAGKYVRARRGGFFFLAWFALSHRRAFRRQTLPPATAGAGPALRVVSRRWRGPVSH